MKTRNERVTRSHVYPHGRLEPEQPPKLRVIELPPGVVQRIVSGLKIGVIIAVVIGFVGLWCLTEFVATQEHFSPKLGHPWIQHLYSPWSGLRWDHLYGISQGLGRDGILSFQPAPVVYTAQKVGWQLLSLLMLLIVFICLPTGDVWRLTRFVALRYRMHALNGYIRSSGLDTSSGITIGAWPEGLFGVRPLRTREPVVFLDHAQGQALIPTLIPWQSGGIVFDESAKLWEETSDVRARRGLRSQAIDFGNPRFGQRYDPIQMIRSDQRGLQDCLELSQALLAHEGHCDNPELHARVELLLASCLMYAKLSGEGITGLDALFQLRDEDDFGYRLALCKIDWVAELGEAYMRVDSFMRVILHQCTLQAGSKLTLLLPEKSPGDTQRIFEAIVDPTSPTLVYFLAKGAAMRDNSPPYHAVFRQLRSRMIEAVQPGIDLLLATNDMAFLGASACSLFMVPHTNLALASVLRPHWGQPTPSHDLLDQLAYAPVRVKVAMSHRDPSNFESTSTPAHREIAHTTSKIRKLTVFEPL